MDPSSDPSLQWLILSHLNVSLMHSIPFAHCHVFAGHAAASIFNKIKHVTNIQKIVKLLLNFLILQHKTTIIIKIKKKQKSKTEENYHSSGPPTIVRPKDRERERQSIDLL